MRAGVILHLHHENGRQRWHLSTGADVDSGIALAVLDSPEVEHLDDVLPLGGAFLPQTFVIKE
jgi:hypothetical protein